MNRQCPRCHGSGSQVSRHGTFKRRSDSRLIQRYCCHACQRTFSHATDSPTFAQKKRRINAPLAALLVSCVSIRRAARILKVSKNTISRRLCYLGQQAESLERQSLASAPAIERVQIDDLLTFEHTKCKPLSLCMAVESDTRLILDAGLAPIPASGHLAAISRRKYGPRRDESRAMRNEMFGRLVSIIDPAAHFDSDGHKHYSILIRRHFPQASHQIYPSVRGAVTGQGELKKAHYDPLFWINHTLAMLRANINRLVRRTWCTTKIPERLTAHLWIYIRYHNQQIRKSLSQGSTSG